MEQTIRASMIPLYLAAFLKPHKKSLQEKDWKLTDKPAKSPFDATQLLSGVLFCAEDCGGAVLQGPVATRELS